MSSWWNLQPYDPFYQQMAQESELSEVLSFNGTSATVLLCEVLQTDHLMSRQLMVQIQ